ncbi:MAG: DUF1549 domain-containing protein, partial [Polyangiaceae bacterium]
MKSQLGLILPLALPVAIGALVAACGSNPPPAPRTPVPTKTTPPPPSPKLMGPGDADAILESEWTRNSVTPAGVADDATYIRRVSLDLVGVIPTSQETETFLADKSPDKRQKLVDSLLASPAYADHMTNVWDRILLGREVRANIVDRFAFRAWLHEQFEKNVPYDKFVHALVTATGQNSLGGK